MLDLLQNYADRILGCLSCFDRVIVWGTLVRVSHEAGLGHLLKSKGIPFEKFTSFASELRDRLRRHLERIAADEGVAIEYLSSGSIRKEDRIQEVLRARGCHPGLVHIFSVVERARVFEARRSQHGTHYIHGHRGKCKQFYLYFIDPRFGLCHLRISSWFPFWVQFYVNGHSFLAQELTRAGIDFTQVDNAFTACADWARAQELASLPVPELHAALDGWLHRYCPMAFELAPEGFHWSTTQAEYATDVVFRRPEDLRALYEHLRQHAILTVQAEDIRTFLQLSPAEALDPETGSNLRTTLEGTRVRHQWNRNVGIKMYDKHGVILRIETTTSEVTFFRHHREVVHKNGTSSFKMARMQKTIHSLPFLAHCMGGCNRRYLTFLLALTDMTPGLEAAEKLAEPVQHQERSYRGFNLLARADLKLFRILCQGEWCLQGFSNADLRSALRTVGSYTSNQISHTLRRLRLHGLIQRIGKTYRYRLTPTGQRSVIAALRLRQHTLVPALAGI